MNICTTGPWSYLWSVPEPSRYAKKNLYFTISVRGAENTPQWGRLSFQNKATWGNWIWRERKNCLFFGEIKSKPDVRAKNDWWANFNWLLKCNYKLTLGWVGIVLHESCQKSNWITIAWRDKPALDRPWPSHYEATDGLDWANLTLTAKWETLDRNFSKCIWIYMYIHILTSVIDIHICTYTCPGRVLLTFLFRWTYIEILYFHFMCDKLGVFECLTGLLFVEEHRWINKEAFWKAVAISGLFMEQHLFTSER